MIPLDDMLGIGDSSHGPVTRCRATDNTYRERDSQSFPEIKPTIGYSFVSGQV